MTNPHMFQPLLTIERELAQYISDYHSNKLCQMKEIINRITLIDNKLTESSNLPNLMSQMGLQAYIDLLEEAINEIHNSPIKPIEHKDQLLLTYQNRLSEIKLHPTLFTQVSGNFNFGDTMIHSDNNSPTQALLELDATVNPNKRKRETSIDFDLIDELHLHLDLIKQKQELELKHKRIKEKYFKAAELTTAKGLKYCAKIIDSELTRLDKDLKVTEQEIKSAQKKTNPDKTPIFWVIPKNEYLTRADDMIKQTKTDIDKFKSYRIWLENQINHLNKATGKNTYGRGLKC